MPANSLRILFAGSGEFGLPTLRTLLNAGHQVIQVYSQPDHPAGRGRALTPTPIAHFAMEQSLPLARTADLNAEILPAADLLIVIAFGQKISKAVAHHARLGSVNLHASRLPRYRGAAPINWAILRGETITGNSVIRLAQRMDVGAVLGQSTIEIGEVETAGELHDRLAFDGASLMLHIAAELAEGRAVEVPQEDSLATTAPKLSRESARLDWSQPSEMVARQIRGLYPWPGCRARLIASTGEQIARLTLIRARPARGLGAPPGAIDNEGHVGTGQSGAVELIEVQPEGKRAMTLAEFRNGHRWEPSIRLETIGT